MIRFALAAAAFLLSALALFPGGLSQALAEDTVFRCGTESVSLGDSRYTVQKICGKPSRSESVAKKSKKKKETTAPKGTTTKSSSGKVEKWHYDRGYGDFVYALTFEGGTLKKIEKTGRGR